MVAGGDHVAAVGLRASASAGPRFVDVEGAEVRIVHTQPSHRFDAKARGRRDTPLPSPLPLDYTAFASAFSAAMNGEAIASTITLAAAEPAVAPTPAGPNPWNE